MKTVHIHLVSDSTGETVTMVARSCLAQFTDTNPIEHIWTIVRTEGQMADTLERIALNPGMVLYTLVNQKLAEQLRKGCESMDVPAIPVLDSVISAMSEHLQSDFQAAPGRQHELNDAYFDRIEAMHYVLSHDDGQSTQSLGEADIIILGVSRTSKTPTCMYLANRGIKAANVPLVPGCPLPPEVLDKNGPMVVGLTTEPKKLVEIRRTRLRMLKQDEDTDYVNLETVTREVTEAKKLFAKQGWPVINVARKSIEEIAAGILQQYHRRLEELENKA